MPACIIAHIRHNLDHLDCMVCVEVPRRFLFTFSAALGMERERNEGRNISDCTITINTTDDGAYHARYSAFPPQPAAACPARHLSNACERIHRDLAAYFRPSRNKTTHCESGREQSISSFSNSAPFSFLFVRVPKKVRGCSNGFVLGIKR